MHGNWKKKTFVQTIFQISTWKFLLLLLKICLLWKTWPISGGNRCGSTPVYTQIKSRGNAFSCIFFQCTSRTKLKAKKLVFCLTHPLIFKTCDKAIEKKVFNHLVNFIPDQLLEEIRNICSLQPRLRRKVPRFFNFVISEVHCVWCALKGRKTPCLQCYTSLGFPCGICPALDKSSRIFQWQETQLASSYHPVQDLNDSGLNLNS